MEATRKNKPKCTNIALPDNMPNSVVGLARLLQVHETYTQDENIVKFINSLNLSDFQIKLIEEATRSQSSSDEWFKQRKNNSIKFSQSIYSNGNSEKNKKNK